MMKFIKTKIPGVVIIEPKIFGDIRGYFIESFSKSQFEKQIGKIDFIQDNESKSEYGVLRGMHFQKPPYAQSKLVRCVQGKVLDVIVDMRKKSSTYMESFSIVLDDVCKRQLFIPKGFAHGFIVLSKNAVFSYKVDEIYCPDCDSGFLWSDVDVDWGVDIEQIILSEKDINHKHFSEIHKPF